MGAFSDVLMAGLRYRELAQAREQFEQSKPLLQAQLDAQTAAAKLKQQEVDLKNKQLAAMAQLSELWGQTPGAAIGGMINNAVRQQASVAPTAKSYNKQYVNKFASKQPPQIQQTAPSSTPPAIMQTGGGLLDQVSAYTSQPGNVGAIFNPRAQLLGHMADIPVMKMAENQVEIGKLGLNISKEKEKDTDVARTVDTGTNILKLDRKGNVLGAIPKAIKLEPVDITNPDGSVSRIMVNPYDNQPIGEDISKTPLGKYLDQAQAQAQAQPGLKIKPRRTTAAESAGKLVAARLGSKDLRAAIELLTDKDGNISDAILMQANVPGTKGFGKGRDARAKVERAIFAKITIMTGAAMTPHEVEIYMGQYWPSVLDPESLQRDKLIALDNFLTAVSRELSPDDTLNPSERLFVFRGKQYAIQNDDGQAQPAAKSSSSEGEFEVDGQKVTFRKIK